MDLFTENSLEEEVKSVLAAQQAKFCIDYIRENISRYRLRISPDRIEEILSETEEALSSLDFRKLESNIACIEEQGVILELLDDSLLNYEKLLPDVQISINAAIEKVSPEFADTLIRKWTTEEIQSQQNEAAFKQRLAQTWQNGLSPIRLILNSTFEIGSAYINHFNVENTASNDHRRIALSLLHRRGCRTASETLCLIENGFADGAMARWRTLHEIVVVMSVINNGDDSVAKRYLDHAKVDDYKELQRRKENELKLGYTSLPVEITEKIEADYGRVIEKYGKDFSGDWGWAAELAERSFVRFIDIEKLADKAHMRYHYKVANRGIHPASKALSHHAGAFDAPVAGASNMGLEEPAKHLAISLAELNHIALSEDPNIDRAAFILTLSKIRDLAIDELNTIGDAVFERAIKIKMSGGID